MKKLLTLVLVLALCGIAYAQPIINITDAEGNSEITVTPSTYVEILIWYTWDTDSLGSYDIEIGNDDHENGTLGEPTITATGRNSVYDMVLEGWTMDWEIVAATDIGGTLAQGIENPLATALFHCEMEGSTCTISGADVYCTDDGNPKSQVVPIINSMVIHQIPEPATIALFCFGGLLLRKKK